MKNKEIKVKVRKQRKKKHPGGRPTKMTEGVLKKLGEAFLMGCTDEEACIFAEISPQTLYNFQEKNKKFLEKKELWKQNPVLKARTTIFNDLDRPESARWYLERKKKDEFAPKQEFGGAIDIPGLNQLGSDIKKILEGKK